MPDSLKNKAVLVVGASSGMGRAVAVHYAREEARVMAAARREDRLNDLRSEMLEAGTTIEICVTDVADQAQVEQLFDATEKRLGGIDILVYAAGTNVPGRSMEILSAEVWNSMLAVNLTGAFHCTKAALPAMRSGGGGLIVYISSIAAHHADLSGAAYQASKRGLLGLAHATRLEEKSHGIRTSVLLPGLCRTDLVHRRPKPTPKEVLDQALEPDDVAEAVLAISRFHPRVCVPEMELLPSEP